MWTSYGTCARFYRVCCGQGRQPNNETLVMAGPLVMDLAARRGGKLLPVDSEHSAIFQAMQGCPADSVERIVLTGSGGPFRVRTRAQLAGVTVDEALRHPTWRMG